MPNKSVAWVLDWQVENDMNYEHYLGKKAKPTIAEEMLPYYVGTMQSNIRGNMFEDVCKEDVTDLPGVTYCGKFIKSKDNRKQKNTPDVTFCGSNGKKFIECKSISMRFDHKKGVKKGYEISRLSLYDENGDRGFDYLVIYLIMRDDPWKIYSMTWEDCELLYNLGLIKDGCKSWGGDCKFPIKDQHFLEKNIHVYNDYDCLIANEGLCVTDSEEKEQLIFEFISQVYV